MTDLPTAGSRFVGQLGRTEVVVVRTEDGEIRRPRQHLPAPRHPAGRPSLARRRRCAAPTTAGPTTSTASSSAPRRAAPSRASTSPSSRCSRHGVEVVLRAGLRQPRPRRSTARAAARGPRARCSSATSAARWSRSARTASTDDKADRRAAVELEGRGRQLPRGLPRAGRAPRPDAAARLQALHRRDRTASTPCTTRRCATSPRTTGPSGCTSGSSGRCPACAKEDERVFRYVAIYPNTVIDLYPDHVLIWKMNPRRRRHAPAFRAPTCAGRTATSAPGSRSGSTSTSARSPPTRTRTWSGGCSVGLAQHRVHARARSPCARRAWPGSPTGSAATSATWREDA